jgi:hypothetical protein
VPFCPECAFEYDSSMLVCPECRVSLVEQLPNSSGAAVSPDDSWVRVCVINDDLTSEMVRNLLDTNNIPSIIMSTAFQPIGDGKGWIVGSKPGIRKGDYLMVPREFRQDVEMLLSAVLGRDFETIDTAQQ